MIKELRVEDVQIAGCKSASFSCWKKPLMYRARITIGGWVMIVFDGCSCGPWYDMMVAGRQGYLCHKHYLLHRNVFYYRY